MNVQNEIVNCNRHSISKTCSCTERCNKGFLKKKVINNGSWLVGALSLRH